MAIKRTACQVKSVDIKISRGKIQLIELVPLSRSRAAATASGFSLLHPGTIPDEIKQEGNSFLSGQTAQTGEGSAELVIEAVGMAPHAY